VSAVAVCAATGVLVIAAAYTAGRLGYAASSWADRTYWLGQALILVPAAVRLLSRRAATAGEVVGLITILTVAEYLAMVCYSPTGFTFADELEHWRSTVNVVQTGQLSAVNYLLPVSPHYPGLEEVTSALVSVTGLSVSTAGLIIAGVAHLLFVWLLYVLFHAVSGSYRIAGIAVLCYASNSHFASFDSMFIYQTLALPFLGLTLLASWRLADRSASGARGSWLVLAVVAIAATVVTHHVTSYVLAAILLVITLAAVLRHEWLTAAWAGLLAVLSVAAAASWLVFAAPQTWTYLQPFADGTLHSLQALFAGGHSAAPPTSAGPLGNRMLSAGTVLVVSTLVPVGWWRVWRAYRDQPWVIAMAIMAVSWYITVAARFTVADGSELAGRAATFTYVPTVLMAALAVAYFAGTAVRRLAYIVALSAPIAVLMLIVDGLANGWPPYWERLPGPHQVAASERSVGTEEIAAAGWALAALGPGNRFATDAGSYSVLGSYGDQNPLLNVAYLYTSPVFTPSDVLQAQAQALQYVWVDQRLSQSLPASGRYFTVDPGAYKYRHPLPSADLSKFDQVPGIARIYDDGNIVIYQLSGS
jgi:4-amino-4-deoxy-L-arabinose transferase-like glycosyltransferase